MPEIPTNPEINLEKLTLAEALQMVIDAAEGGQWGDPAEDPAPYLVSSTLREFQARDQKTQKLNNETQVDEQEEAFIEDQEMQPDAIGGIALVEEVEVAELPSSEPATSEIHERIATLDGDYRKVLEGHLEYFQGFASEYHENRILAEKARPNSSVNTINSGPHMLPCDPPAVLHSNKTYRGHVKYMRKGDQAVLTEASCILKNLSGERKSEASAPRATVHLAETGGGDLKDRVKRVVFDFPDSLFSGVGVAREKSIHRHAANEGDYDLLLDIGSKIEGLHHGRSKARRAIEITLGSKPHIAMGSLDNNGSVVKVAGAEHTANLKFDSGLDVFMREEQSDFRGPMSDFSSLRPSDAVKLLEQILNFSFPQQKTA